MWESDNCVTFDDRSPALHTSDQWQWHETITTFSVTSYTLSSGQATPPARRFLHTQKLSHALPTRVECYPHRLSEVSEISVSQMMIYCKCSEQTMQIFSPGQVPGHCTDDWVLPSLKIKTVKRDAVCSELLASLIRELIIWIRKRDPSTLAALSLSQP